MSVLARPATRFTLPAGGEAAEPPERRGTPRDGVRLLVSGEDGRVRHRRFRDLPRLLEPGDLVVVNTSATVPAALDAWRSRGRRLPVHVSTPLDDGRWVVELRRRDGAGPDLTAREGEALRLPDGRRLTLEAPYPDPGEPGRLWAARVEPPADALAYLARHGRPIGYRHLDALFPLEDHQTVYATEPGSAEMPSAGRPFTAQLLVRLMARGVAVAPVVLHASVSSPELHEPPLPERFAVPAATARQVNATRHADGRVIAVGTTVVRALESAAADDGEVAADRGWTDLVLGPDRPVRAVTGLITGLHMPEASHLLLLEAVAGEERVARAYEEAVANGYLWHEFGDSMLFA